MNVQKTIVAGRSMLWFEGPPGEGHVDKRAALRGWFGGFR